MERYLKICVFLLASIASMLTRIDCVIYTSCSGGYWGYGVNMCSVALSSHCCSSGNYKSATCCRNSCIYNDDQTANSPTTKICVNSDQSSCCSKSHAGTKSCCNAAQYILTSRSSRNSLYVTVYATCTSIDYDAIHVSECTNKYSTECCATYNTFYCCSSSSSSNYKMCYDHVSRHTRWCELTSTYCCLSKRRCCNSLQYELDQTNADVNGAISAGVIGGIVFLLLIIVVPIVACGAYSARAADRNNTTGSVDNATFVQPNHQFSRPNQTFNQPMNPLYNLANPGYSHSPAVSAPQASAMEPPPPYSAPQASAMEQPPPYSALKPQP